MKRIAVSIHTPTKGVTSSIRSVTWYTWFQSTHPRRVWRTISRCYMWVTGFNPHTHEGCDLVAACQRCPSWCFNPHTHEGCDSARFNLWKVLVVSIHTPTKGVTLHIPQSILQEGCFNPHTHEGCDLTQNNLKLFDYVSIHTPTKGVTRFGKYEGIVSILFQSTHPRRVWHSWTGNTANRSSFNPHTHEGCDMSSYPIPAATIEFQSTHPRRVWLIARFFFQVRCCFNPHTHEGCDTSARATTSARASFNPHTHEGCDKGTGVKSMEISCFNPHTHEGCD